MQKISKEVLEMLAKVSKGMCEAGGSTSAFLDCTVSVDDFHHAIKRSHGGDESYKNLWCLCRHCHTAVEHNLEGTERFKKQRED